MNDRTAPFAQNPLLSFDDLPLFDAITPELVGPAVDQLLQAASDALEAVTAKDFPPEWKRMSETLDVPAERFSRAWGAVSHLNSVADTSELRAAYNEALPKVTEFWTRLGADERLYAKYKAMDAASLTTEQARAHHNAMRGFVLGGADLQGEAKARFAWLQERQAELGQKFSENALDATDAFALYVPTEELAGVREDVQQATAAAAQAEGKSGHKLTLKMPCYLPVMQFAHSSPLRERLYRAYATRASDQAEGEAVKFDNAAIMGELLALRH
jgi:oligopeptidase A